jgi:hypothetical protein
MQQKPYDISKKLEIKELISLYIPFDIFSGTLQDVAKNILGIEDRLKTEHGLINKEPDRYMHYEIKVNSYSEYCEIELYGVRLETDEEYSVRKERINKMIENNNKFKEQRASNALKRKRKEEAAKEKEEMEIYLKIKNKLENKQ